MNLSGSTTVDVGESQVFTTYSLKDDGVEVLPGVVVDPSIWRLTDRDMGAIYHAHSTRKVLQLLVLSTDFHFICICWPQMKVYLKFSFKNASSSRIATFAVLSMTPTLSAIAEYLSYLDKYHNITRRRSYSVFGLLPPMPCLPTMPAMPRSKQIRRIHSSKCSTTVRVTRKNNLNSSARNRLTTLTTYPC